MQYLKKFTVSVYLNVRIVSLKFVFVHHVFMLFVPKVHISSKRKKYKKIKKTKKIYLVSRPCRHHHDEHSDWEPSLVEQLPDTLQFPYPDLNIDKTRCYKLNSATTETLRRVKTAENIELEKKVARGCGLRLRLENAA